MTTREWLTQSCVCFREDLKSISSISNSLFIMSNTGQSKISLHFLQFYLDPETQIQTQELTSKQCRCTLFLQSPAGQTEMFWRGRAPVTSVIYVHV